LRRKEKYGEEGGRKTGVEKIQTERVGKTKGSSGSNFQKKKGPRDCAEEGSKREAKGG